jgi:hypothetical protein
MHGHAVRQGPYIMQCDKIFVLKTTQRYDVDYHDKNIDSHLAAHSMAMGPRDMALCIM